MKERPAKSLINLRNTLSNIIYSTDSFDEALQAASVLGNINWNNNDGTLSADHIEDWIFKKFSSNFRVSNNPKNIDFFHVISEAYNYGGHTSLLLNLAAELKNKNKSQNIFIARSASEKFIRKIDALGIKIHAPKNTTHEWVRKLIEAGSQAFSVILHIHPDDIGSAFAARILRKHGCRVLFVNHADHVFSYGTNSADAILEISAFGWFATQKFRPIQHQSFLGIPIVSRGKKIISERDGRILSIGSPHKYKSTHDSSYQDLIIYLAKVHNCQFDFIGPEGTESWWAPVREQCRENVKFHGTLTLEETMDRLDRATAYLDSYPMTGGTTFPQALLAGCTVFGINQLSGGYTLADSLRLSSFDEMKLAIETSVKARQPHIMQDSAREIIADYHSVSSVASRLIDATQGKYWPLPASLSSNIDPQHYANLWRSEGIITFKYPPADKLNFIRRIIIMKEIIASGEATSIEAFAKIIYWTIFGFSPSQAINEISPLIEKIYGR